MFILFVAMLKMGKHFEMVITGLQENELLVMLEEVSFQIADMVSIN